MCLPLGVQEWYALRLLGVPHPHRRATEGTDAFPLSGCAACPRDH